jgi:hypothetical protein
VPSDCPPRQWNPVFDQTATKATDLNYNATRTFCDGFVESAGKVVLGTTWAARFRLTSRRCQELAAIRRFERIRRDVGKITVGGTAIRRDAHHLGGGRHRP